MAWWKALLELGARLINRSVDRKEQAEKFREDKLQKNIKEIQTVSKTATELSMEAAATNVEFINLFAQTKALSAKADEYARQVQAKTPIRSTRVVSCETEKKN